MTAVAPAVAPSDDALLNALLRGAGVRDLPLPGGLTPELMEEVGAVMRETLRGLLDLLAARAHAKREVRADATIIVANDNTPLKFAPGLDAAIAHLLVPRGKGFMPPLRSIIDARESLRSHQEGFLWPACAPHPGAVLARFDPAKLRAAALTAQSGFEHVAVADESQGEALEPVRAALRRDLQGSGDGFPLPLRRGIPARLPGEGSGLASTHRAEHTT